VRGGWRKTDLLGQPLRATALSTKLTKVAAFRRTVCKVEASAYLLRKLRGEVDPLAAEAEAAQRAMEDVAAKLIRSLHETDFETLVDLLLARSGWHRVSALGGTMKDVDMVVEQLITGETAFVQVKSRATQAVLDRYIGIFDSAGVHQRMIFACHDSTADLVTDRAEVILWDRRMLARLALRNGLFDWLLTRAA
jgi:hypothetical protein